MNLARLPPACVNVACSGASHRVIWRDGRLEIPDHGDPDAERALAALGGPGCRCIELFDAWQAHATDPRTLVLGPRGPKISVVKTGANENGQRVRYAGSRAAPAVPTVGLQDLLVLRGGLTRRLLATSAAALIADSRRGPPDRRLHAALYGRVLAGLGRWLGELPQLELAVAAPGTEPSLSFDGSTVHAALEPEWLVDVWGAGLEIIGDRFTLAVTPDGQLPGCKVSALGVDLTFATATTLLEIPGARSSSPSGEL